MPAAQQLLKDPAQSDTSVARWTEYKWTMEGRENTSKLHTFVKDVCPTPPGITFSRHAWVKPPNRRWSIPLRNAQMDYDFNGSL